MKEIKQIIHAYELAFKKQQKAALATVVHVAGSSYRAPGARMLITEDGMLTGAISGGCLEGDALRKALMVMMQGKPLLTTYDTSDEEDAVIGVGLGCNGIIQVLIEPIIPEDATNPILLLQQILQKRQPVVLVTIFSLTNKWSEQQGTRLLLKADGGILKNNIIPATEKDAAIVLEQRESIFIEYPDNVSAFFEYIPPPLSIIVAGAGNDVFPLVQMGEVSGWDITLVDGRPAYANAQRFPACRLIVSDPERALRELVIDDQTAVVLMTHNYNYDKALLRALIAMPVNYIGMLGPRKKLSRMLTEFEEEGTRVTQEQLSRVYSPVGLDIGAETAEEIALAVLAEIKAVFAGRSGVYLRSFTGSMHERKTEIIKTYV